MSWAGRDPQSCLQGTGMRPAWTGMDKTGPVGLQQGGFLSLIIPKGKQTGLDKNNKWWGGPRVMAVSSLMALPTSIHAPGHLFTISSLGSLPPSRLPATPLPSLHGPLHSPPSPDAACAHPSSHPLVVLQGPLLVTSSLTPLFKISNSSSLLCFLFLHWCPMFLWIT